MDSKEILIKALQKAGLGGSADYVSEIPEGEIDYNTYIFNHSFAKAFWGEDKIELGLSMNQEIAWKAHLKQMVLEENPLKYLEKFL